MCKWGTHKGLRVLVPAVNSHTGEAYWRDDMPIDACIADIVQALNDAGIYTAGSCCGHGQYHGYIALHDGRWITLPKTNQSAEEREWVKGNNNPCLGILRDSTFGEGLETPDAE